MSGKDEFLARVQELNGDELPDCLARNLLKHVLTNPTHLHTHTSGRAAPKPRRTRGPGRLTSEQIRYNQAVEAMNDIPHTMEFSLNFSFAQEGSFLNTPDPVDLFERRLNKYLRKQGLAGTPFAFAFDVNDEARLHAHGVIVVKPELQQAVKLALRYAGGFVEGRQGSRQVLLKRDADRVPAGWHRYTTMSHVKVGKLFAEFGVGDYRTSYVSTRYRRLMK